MISTVYAVLAVNGFQETIPNPLLDKWSSFILAKARRKPKADLLKQMTVLTLTLCQLMFCENRKLQMC